MRGSRRALIGLLVVVVVLGLGLWSWRATGAVTPGNGGPSSGSMAAAASATGASVTNGSNVAEASLSREPAVPNRTLIVSLDAGVRGRVRWLSGSDPTRLHRTLHGVPDEDLPAWSRLTPDQTFSVPAQDWIWFCAELEDGPRRWTRYARLPPSIADRSLDLRGGPRTSVHGLVFAAGLDGVAIGAPVFVDAGEGKSRRVSTDEQGFFSLEDLPSSPCELKVPGDAIGSVPRNAMRVTCSSTPPFDAHVIALVAPPTTTPIELELAADAEQAQLDAARLVLRRIDGDGTLVPVLQRITTGAGHATLRVPAGTWLFDVVPRGSL